MRKMLALGMLLGLLGTAAAPAGAQGGHSVTLTGATRNGAAATVSGVATFAAVNGPQNVGGTRTLFGPRNPVNGQDPSAVSQAVATAAGTELTGALIQPIAGGLRFIWTVADLPEQVPPEGVRYTWSFAAGNQTFQLQAKRTNVASSTTAEDPMGHAQQLASQQPWFQVRGACVTSYPQSPSPISGCYHLAFLTGAFDAAANTVTIDMPFQTRDKIGRLVAESFTNSTVITPHENAGSSVAASLQAGVSNTTTSAFINGWDQFFTGPTLQFAVGRSTTNPATLTWGATTAPAPDGSFTATVTGLTAANDTVFVRACSGLAANCAVTSVMP